MTAFDIVDGGFEVLRADPRRFATIAIAFVAPVELLGAYLSRNAFGGLSFDEVLQQSFTTGTTPSSGTSSASGTLTLLLSSLLLVFVAGAVARTVTAWYAGGDVSAGAALGAAGRRWWALMLAWLLVHVAELVSCIGVVTALMVMALFAVTAPVIVVEGLGPVRAMRRSWRLVRRRLWPTVGTCLLTALVAQLVTFAFAAVSSVFLGVSWGWIVNAALSTVAALLAAIVVAGATTLLYLNLRVRTEGLDLEMRAAAVFGGP